VLTRNLSDSCTAMFGTEHLLLAVIREEEDISAKVLNSLGVERVEFGKLLNFSLTAMSIVALLFLSQSVSAIVSKKSSS